LGLLTPIALLALLALVGPGGHASLAGMQPAALLVAALLGASATAVVTSIWIRGRVIPVVTAAERLAAGDLATTVPAHGSGLDDRLARAVAQLGATLATTHDAATTDRLTGVANRPALLGMLFGEVERAARYNRPLSVGFVDIDLFKTVNDSHGHHVGDVVLRGVADILRANVRATDMLGRYGGEEFMLILPETTIEDAASLADKLRLLVDAARFRIDDSLSVNVTVSIGVAGGPGGNLRIDTLVRDADAAMYSAKSLGRNQVYVFSEPNDDARVPRAPISSEGRARATDLARLARMAAEQALVATLTPYPNHRGHASAMIATLSVGMARRMALPEPEVDRVRLAALLHDVGKLALPEEILEKPSALTAIEWQSVVQHPRIGQVILEQASVLRDAVPVRPPGVGHSARRPDRGARRRVRRDDGGSTLQAGHDARPGDPRDPAPRRDAVRPGGRDRLLRPVRVRAPDCRHRAHRGDRRSTLVSAQAQRRAPGGSRGLTKLARRGGRLTSLTGRLTARDR
jgi:diguanylate cyclase (GGDEF)-like protein